VLVADADADTRSLYGHALHLAGCEVVEATDGRDALAKALVRPPAVIVIEIRLPFIDGRSLCEILRRDSATRFVPILVVTGESRALQLQQIRMAGADAVLIKPTTPDEVLRQVHQLIDRADDTREPLAAPAADAATICARSIGLDCSLQKRRTVRAKSHARFMTRTPSRLPPVLMCPTCDRPLTYDHSHVGGNDRQSEQWDYYICPSSCGRFQYRQRTRKLRCV
jgi:two-component system chemotaxis response regulator CheY